MSKKIISILILLFLIILGFSVNRIGKFFTLSKFKVPALFTTTPASTNSRVEESVEIKQNERLQIKSNATRNAVETLELPRLRTTKTSTVATTELLRTKRSTTTLQDEGLSTTGTTKLPTKFHAVQNTPRRDSCVNCFRHDFKLIINSESICKVQSDGVVDLLVLITTEHRHVRQRNAIRHSWMQIAKNNTSNVRYAFTLGEIKDKVLEDQVLHESLKHKDILKEDFVDSYKNLTLKTIMGFKWATLFCPNAKYVMKTDDDMWVNVNGLLKVLESQGDKLKTTVVGMCHIVAKPIRDPRSKWYASKISYPGDNYPGFCSGTGYVTSMEVVRKVYNISVNVPFFYLEDVYVAICIRKLGLSLHKLPGFHSSRPFVPWCKYKSDNVITLHRVPPNDLIKAWNEKC